MDQTPKTGSVATAKKNAARKRKNQSKITSSEPKVIKIDSKLSPPIGKTKAKKVTKKNISNEVKEGVKEKSQKTKVCLSEEEIGERFPVLKNKDLVNKFLNVTMTNNQKGRIRQMFRDSLKSTSDELLPVIIHNKIQGILNSNRNLTDTDLRKIRILYNMLRTVMENDSMLNSDSSMHITQMKANVPDEVSEPPQESTPEETKVFEEEKVSKNKQANKTKGPKRYVVFLGNLPLDITKEKIMTHFSDIGSFIKDVRLPKAKTPDSKAAIAYLELNDEASFEIALSKHHSMLANKRINVMYTTQQNSKITKSEAKGKASKMIALQKSGQLLGSVPANRKRSFRRNKMKRALAKQQEA